MLEAWLMGLVIGTGVGLLVANLFGWGWMLEAWLVGLVIGIALGVLFAVFAGLSFPDDDDDGNGDCGTPIAS